MLTITSTIEEIDILIKNMEYLAPQHNERLRYTKLNDLRAILENKQLLELIKDTVGNDWQKDTEKLIKKIENKEKIQKFTDIYLNSLRSFLIYKALEDVTSSSDIELTKEFGEWIFNARYQGENHIVKWFDVKVSKYFPKTDLPKKFFDKMNGQKEYKITKEWVLNNPDFFFDKSIFNTYAVLLKEFKEKLEKNQDMPELEKANDIPLENNSVDSKESVENHKEKTESIIIENSNVVSPESMKMTSVEKVTSAIKKRLVEVGKDVAGDPIYKEVIEEEVATEKFESVEATDSVNISVESNQTFVHIIKENVDENLENKINENSKSDDKKIGFTVEKTSANESVTIANNYKVDEGKLNDVANTLNSDILPWEDDPNSEPFKRVEVVNVKEKIVEQEKPVEVVKPTFSKPGSFSKPGAGFNKPGSKPGAGLIQDTYDEMLDNIKEVDSSSDDDNIDNEVDVSLNVLEVPDEEVMRSFESVNVDLLFKEEPKEETVKVVDTIVKKDKLFENGMTFNAEREKELEKQRLEDLEKQEEIIKQREKDMLEKIAQSKVSKNSVFMSLKAKTVEEKNEN